MHADSKLMLMETGLNWWYLRGIRKLKGMRNCAVCLLSLQQCQLFSPKRCIDREFQEYQKTET